MNRLLILVSLFIAVAADAEDDTARPLQGELDRRPLHTVVPEYPKNAVRDRIEGEVEVCFNVDRKGRTYRLAVRRSTAHIFEKPALKAIRNSTYQALPKDAPLSGIKTCRTFRFHLEPVAVEQHDTLESISD